MMKCIAGIDLYFAALEPVLDDAGCEVDTDMPSLDVLGGHAIPVRNLPVMAGTIGCVWLVVEDNVRTLPDVLLSRRNRVRPWPRRADLVSQPRSP